MARKPKAAAKAADEVLPEAAPAREGPSDEEQAMVDAEQRDLIARMRAERDAEEAAERANHDAKIERAAAARKAVVDWQAQVEARLAALEAKG